MREIKFRVFFKKNNSMIYPEQDNNYFLNLIGNELFYSYHFNIEELEDYILLQYTGLKDKNDKEIYEGDIVKKEFKNEIVILEIKFQNGSFGIANWMCVCPISDYDTKEMVVVGNIYENPGLIQSLK